MHKTGTFTTNENVVDLNHLADLTITGTTDPDDLLRRRVLLLVGLKKAYAFCSR